MPAPENLTTQTPGAPITTAAPDADTDTNDTPAIALGAPAFTAKHNGGGRWKIWYAPTEGQADWFSDFVSTSKEEAEAEADRLNEGGEPFVAPDEPKTTKAVTTAKPAAKQASKAAATDGAIDPTTLKQAVMTPDGWLCPESPKGA